MPENSKLNSPVFYCSKKAKEVKLICMQSRLKTFFILGALFLFLPFIASAHNPRVVKNGEPVIVQNPEISQAFYGELKGEAQIFEIDSATWALTPLAVETAFWSVATLSSISAILISALFCADSSSALVCLS